MELHPLARGFADVADVYERGRPGYPDEAVDRLRRFSDDAAHEREDRDEGNVATHETRVVGKISSASRART